MAKFISDEEINSELTKIINNSEELILLISPYIKLHTRIKSILETKKNAPWVTIIVVFGKNEENVEKSMGKEDFEFFKKFPNIEIRYHNRLHAKYYASEKHAILTSMNLYDFSQNNNVESGVLLKSNKITDFAKGLFGEDSLDVQAFNYFMTRVVEQSQVLYINEPIFEGGFLGFNTKYIRSDIKVDESEKYFKGETLFKKQSAVSRWKNQSPQAVQKVQDAIKPPGYCIRTGVQIPFNTKYPMSDDSYRSWSKFSNPDYAERFCHFSGEPSNGETSFSKPILKKNWSRYKEIHG